MRWPRTLTWTIEFTDIALRQLEKLDKDVQRRVWKYLNERMAQLENPRRLGEALQGERFGEFCRYRVGDYRLITRIEDDYLVVLVLRVDHRREIYR
jgi:mRNA interferase RelE/StbE